MIARLFRQLRIGITSVAILWCVVLIGACKGDPDADGDGFVASEDCDDENPSIRPSATEQCNAIDDDCDGDIDEGVLLHYQRDADGDGYGTEEEVMACSGTPNTATNTFDCDDSDPDVHPKAPEICANGEDEDCDGDDPARETWYADADGDGFGDPATTVEDCNAPDGFVADASDCDDGDAAVHPGVEERCDNAIDDDCDDVVASSADMDADSWYADACVGGFDCDDGDATIHPDAVETCDEIDSDCDGSDCLIDDLTICGSELAEPDAVLPVVGGSCDPDDGFVEFGGHCYLFVETVVEWGVARANCMQAGGYLATVADEDENAFIDEHTNRAWLGACDADEEGLWTWITREPWAFEYWSPGEPNDLHPGEDCLEMVADDVSAGVWNDNYCDSNRFVESYVCEFDSP